jgi:hypothetical protein
MQVTHGEGLNKSAGEAAADRRRLLSLRFTAISRHDQDKRVRYILNRQQRQLRNRPD